jgi:hypothetical protein
LGDLEAPISSRMNQWWKDLGDLEAPISSHGNQWQKYLGDMEAPISSREPVVRVKGAWGPSSLAINELQMELPENF